MLKFDHAPRFHGAQRSAAKYLTALAACIACMAVAPAIAAADPPTNSTPPSISLSNGSDWVSGSTAIVDVGTWDSALPYETYVQWRRCVLIICDDIDAATGTEHQISADDVGYSIQADVTAVNDEGPNTVSSDQSPVIAFPAGIIDNGVVRLGIKDTGSLNVDNGPLSHGNSDGQDGTTTVGVRLLDGEYDGTAPGCTCEGWGVADASNGVTGWANDDTGDSNVNDVDYATDGDSATSTVVIDDENGDPYISVTHDYQPSLDDDHLYATDVTIEALQPSGVGDLRYRRTIDWDIEPTPYQEMVTTIVGDSPELKFVSDDGFASSDPLSERSEIDFVGEAYNNGPDDHGVLFDFEFGALAQGETKNFKMYYGAASNEQDMLDALAAVGAETFSLGQNSLPGGTDSGEPATFAIGYGGVGGSPAVDPEAPVAVLGDTPDGRTSDTSPEFTFSSLTEGATFECRLDDGDFAACTSPMAYSDLAGGAHTFAVRGLLDGHKQAPPTSFNFVIDITPPDIYFEETPSWWTSDDGAYFRMNADDDDQSNVDLSCSLDGGDFEPCDWEVGLTGLTAGEHTFQVQGVDQQGNADSEPISYTWTISSEVNTRIIDKPDEFTGSNDPAFWIEGSEDAGYLQCKLDGGAWTNCNNTPDYVDVAEGEHTFQARASTNETDWDETPAAYTFTVDTVAPAVTVDSDLGAPVTTSAFALEFHADEDNVTFECEVSSVVDSCSSPLALSGLANGAHSVAIVATDRAGNSSPPATANFTVALAVPPAAPPATPPPAKPTLTVKKPKKNVIGVTVDCSTDTCAVSGTVKVGKKTFKLKGKSVGKGTGSLSFTFGKKLKAALKQKGKKKAKYSVTVSSSAGRSTVTGSF